MDIHSPNVRLSQGLFVWRSSVDDDPVSQHTSLAAFRFFSPLAPSADFFFLRGLVGLTSPRSKTSSGRLQLPSQVSLHKLQWNQENSNLLSHVLDAQSTRILEFLLVLLPSET